MVGIQVGSEQEEKKAKEGSRFRSIVIIHITSNADEELRGRGIQARKIFELDCASPSSLERREMHQVKVSSSITFALARRRGERERDTSRGEEA